ncbi:MAG: UTP--glucose-1-phosphate uridylyltransferase [Planctomycetes bacterium]|nr:UTP--glucose-1-phosphate uridylyltransferase [Planctomycetota bacterium]
MQILNAVIPVAGLGTGLLPSTKSQPKEMLPVGRKPVVQYVVEEFETAGLRRILFVTGRSKHSIENHFDRDLELIRSLKAAGKLDRIEELRYEETHVQFFYTRQSEPKGLGHAIAHAEHFAGKEPFVVGLGDSIIRNHGSASVVERMVKCFEKHNAACVIAFEEVLREQVSFYGIADPAAEGDEFPVRDLIEKPSVEEAPSNLAIAARYVFSPRIFDAIRRTKPGKLDEIQITDAMRILIKDGHPVYGVRLAGGEHRYDIGNFESYFKTFIDFALADQKFGKAVEKYLREKFGGAHGS